MNRSMKYLLVLILCCLPTLSFAGGIAVVDFQRAISEVKEGKTAKASLETMFAAKKKELGQLEQALVAKAKEYEKQRNLLATEARQKKEQELMMEQQQLQQLAAQADMKFQQEYAKKMEGLIGKMREISNGIANEKGLDLILEMNEGGVVYRSASVTDVTDLLIKKYDAKYGG